MSSVQFGKLLSRVQQASSPAEREEILAAAASQYSFTCHQLGVLLMNMRYTSERKKIAALLAPCIVDPENTFPHLLPYVVNETTSVREPILECVVNAAEKNSSTSSPKGD